MKMALQEEKNMRNWIIAASAGAMAVASHAHAQDATAPTGAPDDQTVFDEALAAGGEIIVTAQRREQRLHDVPITLSARTAEELAKAGVESILDLRNVVAGVSFGGQGTAFQPAIRGVNTLVSTGGSENPVALYIDNIYYSTPQILGANLGDVEHIEVLKGPQGTLFGRNSVAGAIRIFTRDPGFETTGSFNVEAGHFTGDGGSRSSPRIAANGFVSIPLADDVAALSVSGGYEWIEGYLTDVASGSDYGLLRRENARAKLLLRPATNLEVLLGAFYLRHNDTGANASSAIGGLSVATEYPGSIIADEPFESAYNFRFEGGPQDVANVETYGFTGSVEWDLPGTGTITSLTGWNDNDILNLVTLTHARTAIDCLTTFACIDYDYTYRTKAFSQELNFVSEPFGIAQVSAGLYYYRNRSRTTAAIQASIVPGGVPSKEEIFRIDAYAGYAEVELRPADQLTVIVGGRYTHEVRDDTAITAEAVIDKKVTFDSFIPRLTVQYEFSPRLNVYATFAQGEKSGLSGISNTASTPPFAPVDAEKNTAYEIGLKYADPRFTFNIAGFYYDYDNKQEQGFTGSAVFLQNSGPARYLGVDADATMELTPELTIRGSMSWLPEAKYLDFPNAAAFSTERNPNGTFQQVLFDATDYRIPRAPKFTGNLGVHYEREMSAGTLDAAVNLAYSSSLYHDLYHVVRQPSYETLNASAGFSVDGVRIGIYGRNLTNEVYINNTATSGLGFFANYGYPREVGVSVSYGL